MKFAAALGIIRPHQMPVALEADLAGEVLAKAC